MAKDSNLTKREHELATVYATGASYREIAGKFSIAPATVRAHIYSVYRKLGVSNKSELLFALTGVEDAEDAERPSTGVRPRVAVVFLRSKAWTTVEHQWAFALSQEMSLALSAYPDVLQTSSTLAPFSDESGSARAIAARFSARYLLLIRPSFADGYLSIRLLEAFSGVVLWVRNDGLRAASNIGWLANMARRLCSVLAGMHGEIARAEARRIAGINPHSTDPQELYLGALHGLETDGEAASISGCLMAERCTQLAPHFGRGWLVLNWRRQHLLVHGWSVPSLGWLLEEEYIFRRAIDADPRDGMAFGYLALSLAKQRRFAEAQRALSRAESLLENNVDTAVELSLGLSTVAGRPVKALELIDAARMLDPEPHPSWAFMEARAAFFSGDPERALVTLLDAPECTPKLVVEIVSATELGEQDRAKRAWRRLLKRTPSFTFEGYARQLPITDVVARARYEHAVKTLCGFWRSRN